MGRVDNGLGCSPTPCPSSAWIQAGVAGYSSGVRELYIEYKVYGQPYPTYTRMAAATISTNYAVWIYHLADGNWQAYVGGYTVGEIALGSAMADTQYTTEGQNDTTHATAEMDAVFSGMQPWGPSSLQKNQTNNEDTIVNVTSSGFEAIQYSYGGSCYPLSCNAPILGPTQ